MNILFFCPRNKLSEQGDFKTKSGKSSVLSNCSWVHKACVKNYIAFHCLWLLKLSFGDSSAINLHACSWLARKLQGYVDMKKAVSFKVRVSISGKSGQFELWLHGCGWLASEVYSNCGIYFGFALSVVKYLTSW